MHDAARRAEELALLAQKRRRLPAGAVALEHVPLGIEAPLGVVLQNRYLGLALLAHHHTPDDLALHLGHAGEIGIEGQLIAALHQLVEGEGLRAAVFVLGLVDHAALEEEFLPRRGMVALGHGFQFVAVSVDVGNLHAPRVHHRGGVPGVVVVAGAVGRKAAPGGGELALDGLLHHRKLHARAPAHRVTAADGLGGAELAQAHQIRVEQPHAGGPGHGEDRCLRTEDHQLSGAHVHAHRADAPLFAVHHGGQQRRGLGAIKHLHAQALEFLIQCGLEGGAPHPQRKFIRVIVGEHQTRLFVAELRARKFALAVAHLAAEVLQVEQAVVALAALDVVGDAVGVFVLLLDVGLGDLLRRDLRAGVGAGRLPVVEAAAGRAAALRRALLHQRHPQTLARSRDGRKAARQAAAQHHHVALHRLAHAKFVRIGPIIDVLHRIASPIYTSFQVLHLLYHIFIIMQDLSQ